MEEGLALIAAKAFGVVITDTLYCSRDVANAFGRAVALLCATDGPEIDGFRPERWWRRWFRCSKVRQVAETSIWPAGGTGEAILRVGWSLRDGVYLVPIELEVRSCAGEMNLEERSLVFGRPT